MKPPCPYECLRDDLLGITAIPEPIGRPAEKSIAVGGMHLANEVLRSSGHQPVTVTLPCMPGWMTQKKS